MDIDTSSLDEYLADEGLDGYAVYADGDDSTQRYLSGFDAPDPFFTVYTPEETALLTSGLEYGRASKEARGTVDRTSDYDYQQLREEHESRVARAKMQAAFLDAHGVDAVAVPETFPVGAADGLREEGVALAVDSEGVVDDIRAVKTEAEIEHVREATLANEASMQACEDLLDAAEIHNGTLYYEDEPLTSERVATEIEVTLLQHGCALDETIVACGVDAADPHDRGSGPLEAGQPIIVDIFPRDKENGYHSDMTRTFVKGAASETIQSWYDLTQEAKEAAFDALEPGATGEDVHAAACEVYEDAGYPTLRQDPSAETGFIHSTGHGIGLDVHEAPSLSPRGGELKPGHIVTIEPGLYDPDHGGVRIEDIAVVTEDGYENFTDYPERLEL
ncbi:M24 family metallopeptidase [Halolamina salifodinae]|uniref:Xaa-Pro aminopeptidase n=1 Tax=Halolamina salifodinae TaxID=1202767 RepID=A0A8T4GWQ3_9EURY|nr:Xaa-Pro peptidase family protein [Halolamina salifodinae]MBP1985728.1 Xaa-Pro aminopeptidase [Halolamina salifodinae]